MLVLFNVSCSSEALHDGVIHAVVASWGAENTCLQIALLHKTGPISIRAIQSDPEDPDFDPSSIQIYTSNPPPLYRMDLNLPFYIEKDSYKTISPWYPFSMAFFQMRLDELHNLAPTFTTF